jgi:hypothetical protein
MNSSDILLLPGWQNSGPGHWQTVWEQQRGCTRVEQHDWQRPLRGDWTARLQDEVLARPGPVVLAEHSLVCLLAAWWAAHSTEAHRVAGALLVAPPEIERDDLRQAIPGWSPPARARLPFPAVVVASTDDPYGSAAYTSRLAQDWGAAYYSVGPRRGHINADSGLGDWGEGWRLLMDLVGSPQ